MLLTKLEELMERHQCRVTVLSVSQLLGSG